MWGRLHLAVTFLNKATEGGELLRWNFFNKFLCLQFGFQTCEESKLGFVLPDCLDHQTEPLLVYLVLMIAIALYIEVPKVAHLFLELLPTAEELCGKKPSSFLLALTEKQPLPDIAVSPYRQQQLSTKFKLRRDGLLADTSSGNLFVLRRPTEKQSPNRISLPILSRQYQNAKTRSH